MGTDGQAIGRILKDIVGKNKDVDNLTTLQSIANQLKDAAIYCTKRLGRLEDEIARSEEEGGYGVVYLPNEPKDIISKDEYDRLSSVLNIIFEPDYIPPLDDFSLLPQHLTYLSVFFQLSAKSNMPKKTLLIACDRAMILLSVTSLLSASATNRTIELEKAANRKKTLRGNKKRKRAYFELLSKEYLQGTKSSRAENIYRAWKRDYEAGRRDVPAPYKPGYIRKLFG